MRRLLFIAHHITYERISDMMNKRAHAHSLQICAKIDNQCLIRAFQSISKCMNHAHDNQVITPLRRSWLKCAKDINNETRACFWLLFTH